MDIPHDLLQELAQNAADALDLSPQVVEECIDLVDGSPIEIIDTMLSVGTHDVEVITAHLTGDRTIERDLDDLLEAM